LIASESVDGVFAHRTEPCNVTLGIWPTFEKVDDPIDPRWMRRHRIGIWTRLENVVDTAECVIKFAFTDELLPPAFRAKVAIEFRVGEYAHPLGAQ
jgi:hypothetical protein